MSDLVGSLVDRLVDEAARRARYALGQSALFAFVAVAAMACAAAGLGCLLVALWIVLLPFLGPAGAWLVIAAVLLLFSAALLLRARRFGKPPARSLPAATPAPSAAAAGAATPPPSGSALAVALTIGVIAGALWK